MSATELNHLFLSTSCFTLGHLKEISFYIFQHKEKVAASTSPAGGQPASQSPPLPQPKTAGSASGSASGIYEIESDIRKLFPDAIMFVYTKEIYLYDLNCTGNEPLEDADAAERPPNEDTHTKSAVYNKFMQIVNQEELELVSTGSFHSKTIFNNPHQPPSNKSLPLIYINFLKAVKRFVVWRLSQLRNDKGEQQVVSFGNHTLCSTKDHQYKLMVLDPIYNFNDELLVNVCTRAQRLERLSLGAAKSELAVYLAPSAVRVYLAGDDWATAPLESTPQNHARLLQLLRNYCNIDLTGVADLVWVKVIPNLNHLNHLTPSIAQYMRDFNQGLKYIVWPLPLCFVQRGVHDVPLESLVAADELKAAAFPDIFGIIDEFVVHNKVLESSKRREIESISAMHTPASVVAATPSDAVLKEDQNVEMAADFMDLDAASDEKEPQEQAEAAPDDDDNDQWDAELFGKDDDDVEEAEEADGAQNYDQQLELKAEPAQRDEIPTDLDFFTDALIDEEIDKYFSDDEVEQDLASKDPAKMVGGNGALEGGNSALEGGNGALEGGNGDSQGESDNSKTVKEEKSGADDTNDTNDAAFIDTSKFLRAAGTSNSFYEDPGAPAPVPFAIIAENSGASDADRKKSVFAPLNFNPAIQESIDSKYLNGGKFYVHNDSDLETLGTETNDTSMKSYTPVTPSLKKGKFDSTFLVSSSDDSDSSLEELLEEDEEEEDDDEEKLSLQLADDKLASPSDSLGLMAGLKRDEMFTEDDKLNSLLLSSPVRRADLALAASNSGTASPTAPLASSENQNWLPFLLKLIPVYTLPKRFLYGNPRIAKARLEEVLPVLLKMFVFDSFSGGDVDCLQFRHEDLEAPDADVSGLLEHCFPGIARTPLADLARQKHANEFCARPNFECLTGGVENNKGSAGESGAAASGSSVTAFDNDFPDNDNLLFQIPQPLIVLNRMDQRLNINLSSLKFWNLLNLQPRGADKHFDILLVVPRFGATLQGDSLAAKARSFVENVIEEYNSSRLGSCSKLDVKIELDSEAGNADHAVTASLSDGVFQISSAAKLDECEMWKAVNDKLAQLGARLGTSPTSSSPLLVLFINTVHTFGSYFEIGKAIAHFQQSLTTASAAEELKDESSKKKKRKLTASQSKSDSENANSPSSTGPPATVKVFSKVLPLNLFYSVEQTYTVVSSAVLNKLALHLYNLCPSASSAAHDPALIEDPFTTICPSLPNTIAYKLTKANITRSLSSNDLYIHLAYERSTDKNWCVASWSDQYGRITNVKAWHCPPPLFGGKLLNSSTSKTFEQISNEVWELTLAYIRSHTGKSYLVLTRLNNIIPDDELVHWKRLSLKTKNLLLIVLAVNLHSNLVLKSHDRPVPLLGSGNNGSSAKESLRRPDSVPSNTGLTPFLFGNGDSPENYMTGGGGIGTGTPLDFNSPTMILTPQLNRVYNIATTSATSEDASVVDITNDSYGFVLPNPTPLSNQQNRISIKTGYLMKTSVQRQHLRYAESADPGTVSDAYTPIQVSSQSQQHHSHHLQQSQQLGSSLHSSRNPQATQGLQSQNKQRQLSASMTYYIRNNNLLEVNLMSCPNFVNGLDLIKDLLQQYRNLANLADCWGMNDCDNLHSSSADEEIMIPWHILSARKCLNALVHVNVTD